MDIADLMQQVLGKVAVVSDDEIARLEAERQRESIQGKRAELEKSGVPARMLNALSNGEPMAKTVALDAVVAWLDSPARDVLVLSGGVGCGKTFAAAYACTKSRWPVFCDPLTLASIKRFEGQFNAEQLAPLADCHLLVLDDLAAEFLGERSSTTELIEALIMRRQAREMRTLVTTNASLEEFRTRYGDRLISRIRESGKFASCGGLDLRKAVKAVG